MGRLARRLFAISLGEVRVARRGFHTADDRVRARLESIGETFVRGYHAGLEERTPGRLAVHLDEVDLERRGFAYEGAAMALALVDSLAPWQAPAWRPFLDGPGKRHAYMVHVGAGWALARLGAPVRRVVAMMDPLLRWLAFDGVGFHEGYFRWSRYARAGSAPSALAGYERRAFDQGLGRSMWFVSGASPERVRELVAAFPDIRRPDLWSGIGLASAYAGAATAPVLDTLRESAGEHLSWLAQGASFAAQARQRAGNPAAHTRLACETLCGMNDLAAARITDEALAEADRADPTPGADYEAWRRGVRDRIASPNAASRDACLVR